MQDIEQKQTQILTMLEKGVTEQDFERIAEDTLIENLNSPSDDLQLLSLHLIHDYLSRASDRDRAQIKIENLYWLTANEHTRANETLGQLIAAEKLNLGHKLGVAETTGNSALPRVFNMANSRSKKAILIHGTWANGNAWYQRGGDFYNYLTNNHFDVMPFHWSGANQHADRVMAAVNLRALIENGQNSHVFKKDSAGFYDVEIYAHSHGGNVALKALRLGLKVSKVVLMGTPVRYQYMPLLRNVSNGVFNVFSLGDKVQIVGAMGSKRGGRAISDSEKGVNYLAEENQSNRAPGHSDLHDSGVWAKNGLGDIMHQ
ncbi:MULTISPECIES: esterase/lipase family protein [Pseudoalteromonas]|uniref:Alpha/beta hydrolase n=1 Tax=Pseudoalteromonas obscura TaxID=3048491 RepID=A0ABT7EG38_9GAMM|nr:MULTISPECIES: alpha/beta hydrolase [Pseudoalteromonas]MBQ4835841.1 alpha/beta hydrolase [Pseudoalteromonas luteoviolacea]MDK2593914.1 alpha/beta hydrolase [Pseudoalteromonas sp. P94(2023)]